MKHKVVGKHVQKLLFTGEHQLITERSEDEDVHNILELSSGGEQTKCKEATRPRDISVELVLRFLHQPYLLR